MLQIQDTLENISRNIQNEILSFYHETIPSKDAQLTENIQTILEDAILFNSQYAWEILEKKDYELPHLSGEFITTILSSFIEDTFVDAQIILKAIQTPLINSAILSLSDRALCSAKSPILMAMLTDVGLVNLSDVISFAFSLLVNEDEYCNIFAHKILKTMSVMIFNELRKTKGLIIEMAIGLEPGSVKISMNNNENNEDGALLDIRWQDSYKGTISLVSFVEKLFEALEEVMTPKNLTYGLEIIRFIKGERGRLNMFLNGFDIEKIIIDDNFDDFKNLLVPLAPQELSEWILRKSEEILSCNNEEYSTQEDYDPIDVLKEFDFLDEDENGNLRDVVEDEEMNRLRNRIGIIDVRIAKSIRTWQDIIAASGGYRIITFLKNHSYIMGRAASDSIRTFAVRNIKFQLPQQENSSFELFWNFIGLGQSSINPADFTGILNCRGKQTMGESKYYNLISYLVQNKNGLTAEEIVYDNDSQFSIHELSMALSSHNHRALKYILNRMSSIEVSMNLGTLLMVSTTTGNLKGIRLILEKIINDTQFMEKQIIDITNTIPYLMQINESYSNALNINDNNNLKFFQFYMMNQAIEKINIPPIIPILYLPIFSQKLSLILPFLTTNKHALNEFASGSYSLFFIPTLLVARSINVNSELQTSMEILCGISNMLRVRFTHDEWSFAYYCFDSLFEQINTMRSQNMRCPISKTIVSEKLRSAHCRNTFTRIFSIVELIEENTQLTSRFPIYSTCGFDSNGKKLILINEEIVNRVGIFQMNIVMVGKCISNIELNIMNEKSETDNQYGIAIDLKEVFYNLNILTHTISQLIYLGIAGNIDCCFYFSSLINIKSNVLGYTKIILLNSFENDESKEHFLNISRLATLENLRNIFSESYQIAYININNIEVYENCIKTSVTISDEIISDDEIEERSLIFDDENYNNDDENYVINEILRLDAIVDSMNEDLSELLNEIENNNGDDENYYLGDEYYSSSDFEFIEEED